VYQDPAADFATAQAVQTVPIQEPSPTVAALPSTGGSLPLLAFFGIVLVAVGASVGVFAARRA
jgi:LPXTG-motif cell wall-anchored protein